VIGNATDAWRLGERQGTSVGEVAYEVIGEGPPAVLVHGTPTRSYLWRNTVPTLAEYRRVYVYDLLGYGEGGRAGRLHSGPGACAQGVGRGVGA
jgi:pimeloyl-ACP methyl ester carboxylesterase